MSVVGTIAAYLTNAEALVSAADAVGLPHYLAAALIEKESGGRNVYGNDAGGVFSTPNGPDIEVTETNFAEFERRVLAGETSNGVGPAQITYVGYIRDAKTKGVRLWVPLENMRYGFGEFKRMLGGSQTDDAIAKAGTLYNKGNLLAGVNAYGLDLVKVAATWRQRLAGQSSGALWYPPADRTSQNYDATPFHRGPLCAPGSKPKLLLHTTEGWGTSWPAYGGGASAPHLTAQPDFANERILWRQHWPLDRYARALATDGRLINDGGPIQVELCGTSGWASPENPATGITHVTPLVPSMPDWYWRELGKFLAWLHIEHGVALQLVPAGFVSWKTSARMSYADWLVFDGVLGHQHAPANTHTDPGAINGARIIEHARAALNGGIPPMADDPRTYVDVYNFAATLRAEGWDIYDEPRDTRAGRCRPGVHQHLADSTHYLRVNGVWVGGAIDVGMDPPTGESVSDWEKANLDDLVRRAMAEGFRCIWGVAGHFDHAHIDFNLNGVGGGHQVVWQGPNAGFTVAHIKWVQQQLTKLGLYSGAPDGLRQTLTIRSIKAFQEMFGLTPDGMPGDNTEAMLKRAVTANAGHTIAHIAWVQTSLRTLKVYTGALDGLRETLTIDAIKRFQTSKGLTPDGDPGEKTTAAIKAALAAPPPVTPPVEPPARSLDERVRAFRVMGPSAYSTADVVASWKPPVGSGVILAARGTPDHVAAAVHAGRRADIAVLLVPENGTLPSETKTALARRRPVWVRAFGGTHAIPSTTVRDGLTAAGISLPA